jgi:hypothetical protein
MSGKTKGAVMEETMTTQNNRTGAAERAETTSNDWDIRDSDNNCLHCFELMHSIATNLVLVLIYVVFDV